MAQIWVGIIARSYGNIYVNTQSLNKSQGLIDTMGHLTLGSQTARIWSSPFVKFENGSLVLLLVVSPSIIQE